MPLQKYWSVYATSTPTWPAGDREVRVPSKVVFMSDRRQEKEIDTKVGKANTVFRERYRFLVTKRELSNTAKLVSSASFILGFCTRTPFRVSRVVQLPFAFAHGHATVFAANAALVASQRQHRAWTVSLHPIINAEQLSVFDWLLFRASHIFINLN